MGVVLDSTVIISAERTRLSPQQILQRVFAQVGDESLAFSAVGFTEVLHGTYREVSPARRLARERFLASIRQEIPILPYTEHTASWAARLGVQTASTGETVPYADLLIGATAMEVGYSVLTSNLRHFRLIPGLNVISF